MAMISATVLVYFTVHVHTRSLMPTYILYNNAVRLTYLVLYNCMFCVCHTKSGQEYLHTTSPNPPKPKPNQTPNRSRYDRNSYQGELTPTGEVTPPSPGDDVLEQVLRGCLSQDQFQRLGPHPWSRLGTALSAGAPQAPFSPAD